MQQITIQSRSFRPRERYEAKAFKSNPMQPVMISDLLRELPISLGVANKIGCRGQQTLPTRKEIRATIINRKRRLVARCLDRQASLNLAEVCRFTGFSFSTVKRINAQMVTYSGFEAFQYPNAKSEEQLIQLD